MYQTLVYDTQKNSIYYVLTLSLHNKGIAKYLWSHYITLVHSYTGAGASGIFAKNVCSILIHNQSGSSTLQSGRIVILFSKHFPGINFVVEITSAKTRSLDPE